MGSRLPSVVAVRQGVFARVFLGCWLSCAAEDTRHTLVFGLNTVCVPGNTVETLAEKRRT